MKRIYMDHAATTYVRKEVLECMQPYFADIFGNASSQHSYGQQSAKAVNDARLQIAQLIGAVPSEIYFTSGGTESDAWALRGIAYAHANKGRHIITSKIEHHAVLYNCKQLEKEGFSVSYIDVDEQGLIDCKQLEQAIRSDTILISVMAANSEVGSIQPIATIGAIAHDHHVVFHTDAVQAIASSDIHVKRDQIDLLSLSGHKFYGPKGIGVLYIKNGLRIDKFMIGGGQERSMRSGTHNTPGIVGLSKALMLAKKEQQANNAYVSALRDRLTNGILTQVPYTKLNGPTGRLRLPNNVNISFRYVEGESILFTLDMHGIAVSTGSACSSGSLDPSHVLLAMGAELGMAHGSIRFTLGTCNTASDIDYCIQVVKESIEKLRALSPLKPKGEV